MRVMRKLQRLSVIVNTENPVTHRLKINQFRFVAIIDVIDILK